MIDADTIKILEHMLRTAPPELDIELHSVEHDLIQSQVASVLQAYCKRPSNNPDHDGTTLYQKYPGVEILEEFGDGLRTVHWPSLQGHPKVVARRRRNMKRNTPAYRQARKAGEVKPKQKTLIGRNEQGLATKHWWERVA